jgi:hypothetical protein
MVVSIVDVVSPQEEYEKQKAAALVDPENPSKVHYLLAVWAYRKEYLEIAQKELQEALKLKPDYTSAELLLKRVEKKLQEASGTGGEVTRPPVGPVTSGGPGAKQQPMDSVDMNRLRLAELRPDERVVIGFASDAIAKFMKAYTGRGMFAELDGDKKFVAYSNAQKAAYILDTVDRDDYEIKDKILIRSEPKFMVEFRQTVLPLVMRQCGTRTCHGGDKPVGSFMLFHTGGTREQLDYMNFYVLDNYKKGGLDMIDRSVQDKSLLLQFGLPEKLAEAHHPKTLTPIFADNSDRKYVQIGNWIKSLRPSRNYDLKFKLLTAPAPAAEEEPAAPPTTAPAWGFPEE